MTWTATFPTLLAATASSFEVYRQAVTDAAGKVLYYTPAIRNDHRHRGHAAVLLATELTQRLDPGDVNYASRGRESGVYSHWAYRCLQENGNWGSGVWLADMFCSQSPNPKLPPGVWTWTPRGPTQYAINDILDGAAALAVSMAATAEASAALDPTLAAQCVAQLAAARASFVERLSQTAPGHGFS